MFKDVIEYLVDLLKPKPEQTLVKEVEGFFYKVMPSDDGGLELGEQIVRKHPVAPVALPTLNVKTLTGFVDAFVGKVDQFPDTVAVQVIDPVTVALVSLQADSYGRRHEYIRAVCDEAVPFQFGTFVPSEKFLIDIQSSFLPTDNVIALQKIASALTSESSIGVQDDGFSQWVTVKSGGVTHADVPVPPRIDLLVYRTFREIDPVRGDFMFRMKGNPGTVPLVTLMDVDAGRWKMNTMGLVGKWLENNLPEGAVIIA